MDIKVPAEGEFVAILPEVAKRDIYDQCNQRDAEQFKGGFHYNLLTHTMLFQELLSTYRDQ